MAGEFVSFKWMNPHAVMVIDVTDAKGRKERWTGETHGATVLGRFGWRPNTFKPGEKLTFLVNPPRKTGQKSFHILTVTTPEGKTYDVNRADPKATASTSKPQ